ncbi:MAG: glycosyl hydrolase family 65 protein [Ilumatobacteraceae bacterium]
MPTSDPTATTPNAAQRFTDHLAVRDDGWTLTETGWDVDRSVAVGSNFMVGNGYLGYRATSPEQEADGFVSLVVADTYDCADGRWRELTTAPNSLFVSVSIGDRRLRIEQASHVETSLDLRCGRFLQHTTHPVVDGVITVDVERFSSSVNLHQIAQRVTISCDVDADITVEAGIDGDVWDLNGTHLPNLDLGTDATTVTACGRTGESGVTVAVACTVSINDGYTSVAVPTDEPIIGERRSLHRRTVRIGPLRPVTIESLAAVVTSNDHDTPAARATAIARSESFDDALAASMIWWQEYWASNDIVIEGNALDDAALRFSSYHNRICIPAHSDRLPVGARGLSCQAYQGAAFWDQEIYNLPAVLFTEPEIARSLLVYRHRTLDGARRKAQRLGYDGAYYAWVSGETGDELCPDVFFTDVLTGREIRNHFNVWQMHVAPDVVTTVARYVQVTDDTDFLVDHGAEIAFEVARFLRSFVRFNDWTATYHCIRVLGPDEWHENVDDNAFTNYQTHAALTFAVDTHERLAASYPEQFSALTGRLGLTEDEVDRWRHVRDHLILPTPDADTRLVEQFAGFFDLEDIRPTDLAERLIDPSEYWGWPNGIAVRTQVSKQADVAMLMWLHADRFDDETAATNYDYYEPRCSHHSSLSHAAYGMVAARLGRAEQALDHFRATARVDLLNANHAVVAGTFIGGIHTAACGGTIQVAVQGIGGLGFEGDTLVIEPALPDAWASLTYPIRWRRQQLTARVTHESLEISASDLNDVAVTVRSANGYVDVEPGQTATL